MVPYYLLLFIPFLIYIIGVFKGKKLDKVIIIIFFSLLIILLSVRNIKVGIDLKNYKYLFESISKFNFDYLVSYSKKGEFLYVYLNKIVFLLGLNFQWFLFIVAIISIMPIMLYYYKKSDNAILTIVLFLTVAPFTMFFSGLRQSIAMGLFIFSYRYVEDKKIVKFIICIVIASFFHKSALFCLVLYPLYHSNISKKWLYAVLPVMVIIFIFNKQIFSAILSFTTLYDGKIESTGAYSMLIVLILFLVYCLSFPDKNKIDDEINGLRNILLLSIIIQSFAPIHFTVMRLNYYYLLFIPILITKVKAISKSENIVINNFIQFAMICFFAFYFYYNGYYGKDALSIFPYVPFWR